MDHEHQHHQKTKSEHAQTEDKKTMKHEGHGGHEEHHDHHRMMIEDFKKRFWVSLILSIPVVILSPMIQGLLGYELTFPGHLYVIFALSSLVFFYGGFPFLKGMVEELKKKEAGMMTLIAVAIIVAYTYSSAVVFGLAGKIFFWELVTLIAIMLLGHWIEMKSVLGASKALELLIEMMPSEAHLVLDNGDIKDISLQELKKGDMILVKSSEKIPADGTIVEGESYVNESMLTGESKPVQKGKDDEVIGGAINGNGSLKIRVENTGENSYLNKVVNMVKEAQKTKSKTQNLANTAAKWLTIVALTAGFGTLFTWLALGKEFVFALERMVTVMVISCPHALGLAIPLVVAISTALSAQNGLLIRNRTAFENSRKISAVVFDKTGTLTKGEFGVSRFESVNEEEYSAKEVLQLASALEQNSEHPIATGIMRKAKEEGIQTPQTEKFEAITGKGVQAQVDGKSIGVVSPNYLKDKNIGIPDNAFSDNAETVVFVLVNDDLVGFIALADEIRPESKAAIQTLKENNIKVYMATGDNEMVAKSVSDHLGLDGYYAEVLPHEKVDIVKKLQSKGEFVAMTGDGVNDAPALANADVGIAVGSGTDVAAETADIILVNSNPKDIAKLILFGKATYQKMIQNLVWATAYNALAIPLAAGVLYPTFVLSPAVGAVLMSMSTVIVAINAQLLKRKMRE
ncbi:MAG: copper-translocating P-type ATPase [Chitinophagales bacterium]